MTEHMRALVQINGRPIASTATEYPHEKTVLEGITIRWGRPSRLSQPNASTATVKIALHSPQDLESLHIGAEITISTDYEATSPVPPITLLNAPERQSIRPTSTGIPLTLELTPAATSTTAPNAWDSIPRLDYGAVISGTINATMPPGSTLHIYALYWTTPRPDGKEIGEKIYTSTTSGTHQFTFTPDISHIGKWLSLRIVIDPIGSTFAQTRTSWNSNPITWDTLRTVWLSRAALTRHEGTNPTATVFHGRISDAPLEYDQAAARAVITLTAVDFTAELANRRVGDEPWPSETIAARVERILNAAQIHNLRAILPNVTNTRTLAAVDIDSRPALELLTATANAAGCILWAAAHDSIGAYIRMENPLERRPLYQLSLPPQGDARLEVTSESATRIPANEIDLQNLIVEQDATDLASSVAVRWQDIDNEKNLIERTAKAEDNARTALHGYRSISISTDLNRQSDAEILARETLTRAAPGSWTIPAATWHPKATPAATVIKLLDATRRLGLPLILDNVAPWVPGAPAVPVYLDGGTYTYQGGAWNLDLNLTRSATPGASIKWHQLPPAYIWNRIPLTWLDMSTAA